MYLMPNILLSVVYYFVLFGGFHKSCNFGRFRVLFETFTIDNHKPKYTIYRMDQIIIIISIPLSWEVGCMTVILIELTFTIDNHELPFMVVFSTPLLL
jgi:hypothetical protein